MPQIDKPNWWDRNWKWFVPTLGMGSLLLFIGFIAALFFGIMSIIKHSDSYQMAISTAKAHPKVVDIIGLPIKEGTLVNGEINESGSSGDADLQIALSGPKNNGVLYLVASKTMGKWAIQGLVLEVESTKERINLLENSASQTQPPLRTKQLPSSQSGDFQI